MACDVKPDPAVSRLDQSTDFEQSCASGADFHRFHFGSLGIRFAKQSVQQVREHMRHHLLTIRQEAVGTESIHVQTVLEFTDGTFGDTSPLSVETLINACGM